MKAGGNTSSPRKQRGARTVLQPATLTNDGITLCLIEISPPNTSTPFFYSLLSHSRHDPPYVVYFFSFSLLCVPPLRIYAALSESPAHASPVPRCRRVSFLCSCGPVFSGARMVSRTSLLRGALKIQSGSSLPPAPLAAAPSLMFQV